MREIDSPAKSKLGLWAQEHNKKLAAATLPELNDQVSQKRKAEILKGLVQKLQSYVAYDQYDPRQLNEFTHEKIIK
jgi:hypothetical protein